MTDAIVRLLAEAMKAGGLWPNWPSIADPSLEIAGRVVKTAEWDELIKLERPFRHIDWCASTGAYGDVDCSCPETPREEALMKDCALLREKAQELDALFTLQWRRMGEATSAWRADNPGNDLVMPDLGDLLTWLLNRGDLGTAWAEALAVVPVGRGLQLGVAVDGPGYVARVHLLNGETVEAWSHDMEEMEDSPDYDHYPSPQAALHKLRHKFTEGA